MSSARGILARIFGTPGSSASGELEYPYRPRARWGWDGAPVLQRVDQLLGAGSVAYEEILADVLELQDWARTIPRDPRSGEPCWENDWWGTIDAVVQCAVLKRRQPASYLEIGSGFSTLFARRAILDFELKTRIVSIDPAPRAEVDSACDDVIRRPFEDAAEEVAGRVAPGDVILVDGSHLALMNTDATAFFLELLPELPAGVLVGIDDVFLPWDYPPSWSSRRYGEQYLLASFLLGGAAGYTVRWPAWWVLERSPLAEKLSGLWPIVENRFGRHAASFWLERDQTT